MAMQPGLAAKSLSKACAAVAIFMSDMSLWQHAAKAIHAADKAVAQTTKRGDNATKNIWMRDMVSNGGMQKCTIQWYLSLAMMVVRWIY